MEENTIEPRLRDYRGVYPWWKFLQLLGIFILVVLAWMLFRANTMADAALIWQKFLQLPQQLALTLNILQTEGLKAVAYDVFGFNTLTPGFGTMMAVIGMGNIFLLFFVDWFVKQYPLALQGFPTPIRWGCYLGLTYIVLFRLSPPAEFIYFQF